MSELISTSDTHEDSKSQYYAHKTPKLQQCAKQNITSVNKREKVGKYLLGKVHIYILNR